MTSPGVFHGAYGLCSLLSNTTDGFRNADLLLDRLVAHGVRSVFINPGSTIAPVLESLARFALEGRPAPEPVLSLSPDDQQARRALDALKPR